MNKPIEFSVTPVSGRGSPSAGLVAQSIRGSYWKGVAFCVVATILMGIMFPVMTSALVYVDPFTFTSLRYLIAGAAFLTLLLIKEGKGALKANGESFALAWLLGSVGFCGFGSFVFLGQQLAGREGALTASIMMATQPMMGLLVNSIVRKHRPPFYSFLFILMSFAGVSLVVTKGDVAAVLREPQHYSANALIVLGALCWVIYTFSVSHFKRWSALKYTTMTTWLGLTTIIGLNVMLFALHVVPVPSATALHAIVPHLLYMGPIAGFIAILFWNTGTRFSPRSTAFCSWTCCPSRPSWCLR
ncbi:DMT family transporter [Paraburkholderia sp. SEWSISQ10-3 4]|uniref:DMT family transporter n=1 Tax=Paraburkholderia TaxID=1822464 RepID=UPI0022574C20|nr:MULTISPECIES: DMT family transporter [Paraburkholderia]MCX4138686.1 DMT family transporter [Paraburkholderia aspalathi]MDN7171376.1 DMT family transporter [Paraburkholderia sp. SEWSISQ10-3 4]MDQ6501015.1 DMT family transporter [Paraburkholderia aspalathi]